MTARYPDKTWNLHFHNTRGLGLANVLAGLQAGVSHYDSSLGGLGGCPFAPGAPGNVASELVVGAFAGQGISTGIDLDRLTETGSWIRSVLGRG